MTGRKQQGAATMEKREKGGEILTNFVTKYFSFQCISSSPHMKTKCFHSSFVLFFSKYVSPLDSDVTDEKNEIKKKEVRHGGRASRVPAEARGESVLLSECSMNGPHKRSSREVAGC